jgi:uncharacterized membrane protein YeaQ/YmgE (transglycosylase-associated protein family)
MEFFWFIVTGAIAGWLAGPFMRGRGFAFVGDLCVGAGRAVWS